MTDKKRLPFKATMARTSNLPNTLALPNPAYSITRTNLLQSKGMKTPKLNNSNMSLNTTRNPTTLATDWEMECNVTYNTYLQALMLNSVVDKVAAENDKNLIRQLLRGNEVVTIQLQKKVELESKIKELEIKTHIVPILNDLNNIKDLCNGFDTNKFEELDKCISYLELAYGALILKEVKPLEPEDYNKLQNLVKMSAGCADSIKHMMVHSGKLQSHFNCVADYSSLFNSVNEKDGTVNQHQLDLISTQIIGLWAKV